ncbi:MAG: hypothetical protein GXO58_06420 [Thermodesulfobacteria bacterium]|nr:hypothetical protein [Thermodesulfobacteriota bacterium]
MLTKFIAKECGMALITTLLLALLGVSLVVGLFYISKNMGSIFGINSRYFQELEDAKSIANFIAGTIMSASRDLECGINGSQICVPNPVTDCNSSSASFIHLPSDVYDSSHHTVKACYLFNFEDPDAVVPFSLHGFWIKVNNPQTGESVNLDFVYKVQ